MDAKLNDLFPKLQPHPLYGWFGLLIAAFVTTGVAIQPFVYTQEPDVYFERLALAIFGLHLSTLLGVGIEAFVTKGRSPAAGMLTIGSGILATLLQVALLNRIRTPANLDASILILALQCIANSLMLSFIIGDLRIASGYAKL